MKQKPTFIKINEEGLDEFFIMKHKLEKSLKLDKHVKMTPFIQDYVKRGDWVYSKTGNLESVPFNKLIVDGEEYIIYTSNNDDAEKEFLSALASLDYDLSKLVELQPEKFRWEMKGEAFFTNSGKMLKMP